MAHYKHPAEADYASEAEYRQHNPYEADATGRHLFDVTAIIGSVYQDEAGTENPTVAAFKLIGEHGAPGVYRFPREDGRTVLVEVSYEGEAGSLVSDFHA